MSTNTPKYSIESLTDKVSNAAKVVEGVPNHPLINPSEKTSKEEAIQFIWDKLARFGVYQDEFSHELLMSDDCTEGDARRIFCEEGMGSLKLDRLPLARFKRVWSILKGSEDLESESVKIKRENVTSGDPTRQMTEWTTEQQIQNTTNVSTKDIQSIVNAIQNNNKPVGQWTDEELLLALNPDCDTEIIDVLDKRAQNRPFVIYRNEETNEIDIDTTKSMLKQARKGRTLMHFKVGTSLKKLYRVGDFPSDTMYECPFHPTVILVDGYCDECGHVWDVKNYEAMQFARVLFDLGMAPKDSALVREFIQETYRSSVEELGADYPKAYAVYEEKKKDESLPRLKRRTSLYSRNVSDPMNVNRKY